MGRLGAQCIEAVPLEARLPDEPFFETLHCLGWRRSIYGTHYIVTTDQGSRIARLLSKHGYRKRKT